MKISPRDLVAGSTEVASLPEIFIRINEMVDDPSCSTIDIGKVIGTDAAFTARLLKLVNSPFFGFPSRIDTLSRAVTIIGTKELRELVLATSVIKLFSGLPNDLVTMDRFWQHSILCGLLARTLASHLQENNIERYFVAGLLHDIGTLVIYRKLPDLAREALLRANYNGQPLYEAQREVIGLDSASVGGELIRNWRLPTSLEQSVEFHHEPTTAKQHPAEASIIHVANVVTTALELGGGGPVPPLSPQAWELTGLSPAVLELIVAEVDKQFRDTYSQVYSS